MPSSLWWPWSRRRAAEATPASQTATRQWPPSRQAPAASATTEGDTVAIVYDTVAGGNTVFGGRIIRLVEVDGVWTVSREELCGAVAVAGIECPA
ncbi:MAG: hypothetical protein AAGF73_01935 [Actinomycetota bacterium]